MTDQSKEKLKEVANLLKTSYDLLSQVCKGEEQAFKKLSPEEQDSEKGSNIQYDIDDLDDVAANLRDMRKTVVEKIKKKN